MFSRFEQLSSLFIRRIMMPTWIASGEVESDSWSSLRVFVSGYAFERLGRAQDYSHAAADTIDELRSRRFCPERGPEVWQIFSNKLGGTSLNHANNPLCPCRTEYKRKYRGEERRSTVGKQSVIDIAANELGNRPLVAWAKSQIENHHIPDAHKTLRKINGINNKLASLFLRDVVLKYQLIASEHRELLQPMDRWVRFLVQELNACRTMDDKRCARYVVTNAKEPERANAGMWYFCAIIASSSKYVVVRCLREERYFDEMARRHILRLENDVEAAQRLKEEIRHEPD